MDDRPVLEEVVQRRDSVEPAEATLLVAPSSVSSYTIAQLLIQTVPASICRAIRKGRSTSVDQTDADSPYSELLCQGDGLFLGVEWLHHEDGPEDLVLGDGKRMVADLEQGWAIEGTPWPAVLP